MFRTFVVLASVAGAAVMAPAADEPGKFKFGEPFKGEVGDTLHRAPIFVMTNSNQAYMAEIPVALKAGQDISITCTVVGKDRRVLVVLLDPKGAQIGLSKVEPKTVQFKVEEVNATGEYKIQVFTDLIGPFTLRATASSEEELDVKALEEKIRMLKQELADIEARLKKIKAKNP